MRIRDKKLDYEYDGKPAFTVEYKDDIGFKTENITLDQLKGSGSGNIVVLKCSVSYDGTHVQSITSPNTVKELREYLNNDKTVILTIDRDNYSSETPGTSKINFIVYDVKENTDGTYNIFGIGYGARWSDGYDVYHICSINLSETSTQFTVVQQTHEFTWGHGAKLIKNISGNQYNTDNIHSAIDEGRFPVLENHPEYIYFGCDSDYQAKFFNLEVTSSGINVQKAYLSPGGALNLDDHGSIPWSGGGGDSNVVVHSGTTSGNTYTCSVNYSTIKSEVQNGKVVFLTDGESQWRVTKVQIYGTSYNIATDLVYENTPTTSMSFTVLSTAHASDNTDFDIIHKTITVS